MLDYYVIIYLVKKFKLEDSLFGGHKKFLRFQKSSYWFFWGLFILRFFFDRFMLIEPVASIFYLASYWGQFSFILLIAIYYTSLIIFPFLAIFLIVTGLVASYFFPSATTSRWASEAMAECHKYHREGKFAYGKCGEAYCSRLIYERRFKEFLPEIEKLYNEVNLKIKNGEKKSCDPAVDQDFLISSNQYGKYKSNQYRDASGVYTGDYGVTCDYYSSLFNDKVDVLSYMAAGWEKFNPLTELYWLNYNVKTGKIMYRERDMCSLEGCIKICNKFPEIAKQKANGYKDAYLYKMRFGKLPFPLECEYRCQNRDQTIKKIARYGADVCSVDVDYKKDEKIFENQYRTCWNGVYSTLSDEVSYCHNKDLLAHEEIYKNLEKKYRVDFKKYKESDEYKEKQKNRIHENPVFWKNRK